MTSARTRSSRDKRQRERDRQTQRDTERERERGRERGREREGERERGERWAQRGHILTATHHTPTQSRQVRNDEMCAVLFYPYVFFSLSVCVCVCVSVCPCACVRAVTNACKWRIFRCIVFCFGCCVSYISGEWECFNIIIVCRGSILLFRFQRDLRVSGFLLWYDLE